MFFQVGETPLIERIEQRIADLVDMPAHYGEGLQVLHYQPGQQYEPHFDWFDPEHHGYEVLDAKAASAWPASSCTSTPRPPAAAPTSPGPA